VPGQALTYGQSITDGCIAFADTVPVLRLLAQAVQARRVVVA
jgi:3-deoxy-7-phosphoheptulonate synthase